MMIHTHMHPSYKSTLLCFSLPNWNEVYSRWHTHCNNLLYGEVPRECLGGHWLRPCLHNWSSLDDFHLGVWSFSCECVHYSELELELELVFSTGMKNLCKHDTFSCPGVRKKHLGNHHNYFHPGMKLVAFHPRVKSFMKTFWDELTPGWNSSRPPCKHGLSFIIIS